MRLQNNEKLSRCVWSQMLQTRLFNLSKPSLAQHVTQIPLSGKIFYDAPTQNYIRESQKYKASSGWNILGRSHDNKAF